VVTVTGQLGIGKSSLLKTISEHLGTRFNEAGFRDGVVFVSCSKCRTRLQLMDEIWIGMSHASRKSARTLINSSIQRSGMEQEFPSRPPNDLSVHELRALPAPDALQVPFGSAMSENGLDAASMLSTDMTVAGADALSRISGTGAQSIASGQSGLTDERAAYRSRKSRSPFPPRGDNRRFGAQARSLATVLSNRAVLFILDDLNMIHTHDPNGL